VTDVCADAQAATALDGRVLDFGCGWGRVIRFFLRDRRPAALFGSDYNEELLASARAANRWVGFVRNGAAPPIAVDDDSFSLVYVYSVFSHFSEEMHALWLEELRRILSPGGVLVVSVRPRSYLEYCASLERSGPIPDRAILDGVFRNADEELRRYDEGEFCYQPYNANGDRPWWGEAVIPLPYIERSWRERFEVVRVLEADAVLRQHLIALRK
jgi:SAM-dependent methyltransferase